MKKTIFAVLVPAILTAAISIGCANNKPAADSAAAANSTTAANGTATTAANTPNSASSVPFADHGKVDAARPVAAQSITLPAGTPVTVRLQNAVSSASSNSGDKFDAVLDLPLVIEGKTIAPAGANVVGRVVAAKSSGHLKDPGMIQLALSSIIIDGREVPVTSSSVIARGSSHEKRNWAMIGGGTAGGALIGGLAGGGKGALIGSAIGAGAGTTGAYATGKKDVGFGAERRLTFRLRDAVVLKG
jgi:hypothetical protein